MNSKEALENLGRINLGDNPYCIFEDNLLKNCCKEEYEAVEKDLEILEEYRKIEKELGIDLITLFKTLKSGVKGYKSIENLYYDEVKEMWYIECIYKYGDYGTHYTDTFALKDYGKTWTLTNEELENVKN